MPKTYSDLQQAVAQAGRDAQAKQPAIEELLAFVRAELDSPRTARDRIKIDLEVLHTHGKKEDIQRIDDVITRRTLDDVTVDFAREIKRQIQERCYLLTDISQEEEEALRTRAPTPRDPKSRWLAIWRGVIVVEGAERAEVEAEITRRQRARSSYVALVIPVDGALRNSHERR